MARLPTMPPSYRLNSDRGGSAWHPRSSGDSGSFRRSGRGCASAPPVAEADAQCRGEHHDRGHDDEAADPDGFLAAAAENMEAATGEKPAPITTGVDVKDLTLAPPILEARREAYLFVFARLIAIGYNVPG